MRTVSLASLQSCRSVDANAQCKRALMSSFSIRSQVIDDGGNDVTPQPLMQLDPNTVRKNQSNILADSSAGTVRVFQLHVLKILHWLI